MAVLRGCAEKCHSARQRLLATGESAEAEKNLRRGSHSTGDPSLLSHHRRTSRMTSKNY